MEEKIELMLQVILQQQKTISERDARIKELTEQSNTLYAKNCRLLAEVENTRAQLATYETKAQPSTCETKATVEPAVVPDFSTISQDGAYLVLYRNIGPTRIMLNGVGELVPKRAGRGEEYWAVVADDFYAYSAERFVDEHREFDNYSFDTFNYFCTEQAAKEAVDLFKSLLKYLPKE